MDPIILEIHTTPETHNEPSPVEPEHIPTEPSTPQSEVSKSTPYDSFVPYTNKETTPVDTTSERSSTIIGRTTETVEFNFPTLPANSPPVRQHRTKKVAVTSGKYFRYLNEICFWPSLKVIYSLLSDILNEYRFCLVFSRNFEICLHIFKKLDLILINARVNL